MSATTQVTDFSETKQCSRCGFVKGTDEFYTRRRSSNGRQAWCRDCMRAYAVEWNKVNVREAPPPEITRVRNYKKKYGITVEQYDEMFAAQGGVCAICRADEPRNGAKNFCIDHDHKTGSVRGLLCVRCNAGIGSFSESIDALQNAIDYLQRQN